MQKSGSLANGNGRSSRRPHEARHTGRDTPELNKVLRQAYCRREPRKPGQNAAPDGFWGFCFGVPEKGWKENPALLGRAATFCGTFASGSFGSNAAAGKRRPRGHAGKQRNADPPRPLEATAVTEAARRRTHPAGNHRSQRSSCKKKPTHLEDSRRKPCAGSAPPQPDQTIPQAQAVRGRRGSEHRPCKPRTNQNGSNLRKPTPDEGRHTDA